MVRLKLTAPLHSRDGTLAKGARMKNLIAEANGDVVRAAKRPGASALLSGTAAQAQGMVTLNGTIYTVSGDTLRKIVVAPPSFSTTWAL